MIRTAVTAFTVLALASCAQPDTESTVAPDGPPPTASATATTAPTAAAQPSATPSTAPDVGRAFESQDGAVRFALPEGWSVDDRSAMGEATEMYDRGPGWLNELVILDAQGDQMVWYREHYGNDYVVCGELWEGYEQTELAPLPPGQGTGPTFIVDEVAEATRFGGTAAPGAWSVAMRVLTTLPDGQDGCTGLTDVLWTGSRAVWIDAVGDSEDQPGVPDTTIDFADERSARAGLEGAEHDAIVDVLTSLELTDAPILDRAPRRDAPARSQPNVPGGLG
jgi:hypothetical protein